MAEYSIVKALKKKLEGDIEKSKCNIQIYLEQSVGIGEHPQHIDEVLVLENISTLWKQ